MWQEDSKDLLRPKRHGIRSYFPVMGPGTVTFGDLVVHMTQIHSIHGVRNDCGVCLLKITRKNITF